MPVHFIQGIWKELSLKPASEGVRYAITKLFDDVILQNPICARPKGRHHTSIFHGATDSSEEVGPYVLTLKPDSQSVRHAIMEPFNDGVLRNPICRLPKGHPHTSIFHGTTKSYSGSIRNMITEPFNDSVLHHPICPPPKGCPYTSILHGPTDNSEEGSLCWVFLVLDSWSVRHAITEPFYDVILHYAVCPLPKGRLHTSILHGATESAEGGVMMPGFFSPGCLESAQFKARFRGHSWSVRNAITEPFYDIILRHPICPPPKGCPHTSILHGAIATSDEGVIMPSFFSPGCLEGADFDARFPEH
ncbi:hypothetical protein B9Z19DRAFT_1134680 [Tuber borchii]|uniref:Uncharacterized protein n=1 Tax=Tuber borchii TaxID=42251 RepID=A0A2T6ZDY1_TUBBO|nr:hypothetical protein B9Z19DRAFT_1134680 [Tuber borchii]